MNKLKKAAFLILFSLLSVVATHAQTTTTVTLQVTDTGSQTWNFGTWQANLRPGPGNNTQPANMKVGGSAVPNIVQSGSLDSGGAATLVLTQNGLISPLPSYWALNVCPAASSSCFTFNVTAAGSTQSVSPTPPVIAIGPDAGSVSAYADSEIVNAVIGSTYYNLTSNIQRICNGPAPCTWADNGGGGPGGGVTSVGLLLPSSVFAISGTPVTTNGVLTGTFKTQNPNIVWAGPVSGAAATPTFRSLVLADLPSGSITGTIAANQVATGTGSNTIGGNNNFTYNASTGQAVAQINCTNTPVGEFVFCGDGLGTVWNGDSAVQESIAGSNSVWNYCMSNAGSTGQTGSLRPYFACIGMDASSSASGGLELAYVDKAFSTSSESAGVFLEQATTEGNLGHNITIDAVNASTTSLNLNVAGYNEAVILANELVLAPLGQLVGNGISAAIASTNTTSAGCTLGLPQATAGATGYVLTVTSIAGGSASHPGGLCQTAWQVAAAGGGVTLPQTIGGTVNSGGIMYFNTSTQMSSSAVLPSGDFVLGGGAGGAPTASFSVVTVAKGGTGTGSTLTGILRGNASAMTAAELSGDATTSGSNAVTVVRLNGTSLAALPTGLLKITTGTGVPSIAIGSDIIATMTGTCNTTTFVRGDASCQVVAGSISGLTTGFLPKAASGTTIANSLADDGITTANAFTYSGAAGIIASAGPIASGNDGVHPGLFSVPGNTTARAIVANLAGIMGPNTTTFAGYWLQMSATGPSAAGLPHTGAPSSGISQLTFSPIVGSDMTNNTVTGTQLAAQYSKLRCDSGLGDGTNAIAAATYLQTNCYNDSTVTWTIGRIGCFTDNAGTSSLAATNGAGTALLTGAVTCTAAAGGAAGTQSGTTTIASGDVIKFTYISDGTSKQTGWFVSLTQ